jgi:hypothetical protein
MSTRFSTKRKWIWRVYAGEIEELRSIIRWLGADRTGSTDASGESLPTSGRTPKWFLERDERAA